MAASKPTPKPAPAPAPAPKPTPAAAPAPSPQPGPSPKPTPAPAPQENSAPNSTNKGVVQNILESPVVAHIETGIANKATNTPTLGSAITGTIRDSGGFSQIIPNTLAIVKLYGPPILGGVLQLLLNGASS
ncbi:hypothetical protein MCEJIRE27_00559 [Candidatus Nanopelagicaceae bacterium]